MPRIVEILLTSLVVLPALFGQQAGLPKKNTPATSGPDRKEVEALRGEIAFLKGQLAAVNERIESLQRQMNASWVDLYQLKHDEAEFDPSSPGPYQRLNTEVGPLLLSVGGVEQYLDGYKVSLKIGNPLSVTFNGFEIETAWGPRFKEGEDYAKWYVARQTKKTPSTQQLLPGSWSLIDIILPSTEAKSFGFLNLKIAVDRLLLASPSR